MATAKMESSAVGRDSRDEKTCGKLEQRLSGDTTGGILLRIPTSLCHIIGHVHVYDEYKQDVVGFHEVQSEMLRKVHDEFQKTKICMREHFRSLEATMKCMMETVTNGHVGASNISGGNKAPEGNQLKSLFVERNENHKIEMYGDPIYDK
ncbi:hypothetical protein Bca4012_058923 [Brassica carinata]